jgi:hypothetical protein
MPHAQAATEVFKVKTNQETICLQNYNLLDDQIQKQKQYRKGIGQKRIIAATLGGLPDTRYYQ